MTASTEAASDSDTDSSPDISGGTAADQPATDDTDAGAAPGHDAGVGIVCRGLVGCGLAADVGG